MKKIIRILFLFLICMMFSTTMVFASTNTFERTADDYKVASWVTITDSNRDNILKTPAVDASEKIYDFADLFTASDEEKLYAEISDYINSSNMDLAIVTINENNKGSQAVYADDFYDYNDFGRGGGRDGVLFLIDMQYRQIYMSTTGSAINMYNDYRINKALDAVYSYMSSEDYYYGVSRFISIIGDDAAKGLPNDYYYESNSLTESLMYASIGSLIITGIIMFILIRKNKLVRKATTAKEYLDSGSVVVNNMGDVFLGSNTVKHRIEHSSSSGGSSTHSSSSGSSHGGGGHGF